MIPPAITAGMALLLDLDGTLIDFAATPDAVVVPAGLADNLLVLRERLGGALAIITGRPVGQIDALLPEVAFAVAGEHGGAIRHAPAAAIERGDHAAVPADWLDMAEAVLAGLPGTLLERKAHGVALHFRRAPGAGAALLGLAEGLVGRLPGHVLLAGNMVWEVRPRGVDKGGALRAIMGRAPFLGRVPVFVGDDVTDEDAIAAAGAMGGIGLRVADSFGAPQGVRDWLAGQAGRR